MFEQAWNNVLDFFKRKEEELSEMNYELISTLICLFFFIFLCTFDGYIKDIVYISHIKAICIYIGVLVYTLCCLVTTLVDYNKAYEDASYYSVVKKFISISLIIICGACFMLHANIFFEVRSNYEPFKISHRLHYTLNYLFKEADSKCINSYNLTKDLSKDLLNKNTGDVVGWDEHYSKIKIRNSDKIAKEKELYESIKKEIDSTLLPVIIFKNKELYLYNEKYENIKSKLTDKKEHYLEQTHTYYCDEDIYTLFYFPTFIEKLSFFDFNIYKYYYATIINGWFNPYLKVDDVNFAYLYNLYKEKVFYVIYDFKNLAKYLCLVALLIYFLVLVKLYMQKLFQQKKKAEDAYNSLETFRKTYEKIQNDFVVSVTDSTNALQDLQSNWDTMCKNAAQLGRHDLVNDLNDLHSYNLLVAKQESGDNVTEEQRIKYQNVLSAINDVYKGDFFKDIYQFFFSPCIEKIHKDLKGLENVLDLSVKRTNAKEIRNFLAQPDILPVNLDKTYNVQKTIQIPDDEEDEIDVIMSKLQSIIFNLAHNSSKAIDDHLAELFLNDDEGIDNYEGQILLDIAIAHKNNKKFLSITMKDNGGGFPESIIKDIYNKPVATTKDGREFGEGTAYIGFFVKLMNGFVEAENYINDKNEKGAITRIYIPFIDDSKEIKQNG